MNSLGVVYGIIERASNSVVYVGVDGKHNGRGDPNYFGSGIIIRRKLKAHGKEAFKKVVIEKCGTREKLEDMERYWIKELDTLYPSGYNLSDGGYKGNTFIAKTEEEMEDIKRRKNKTLKAIWKQPEFKKEVNKRLRRMRQNPEIMKKISLAGRGEKNSMAKISDKDAELIVRYLSEGWLSKELSKHIGISRETIKCIKIKHTHRHLQKIFPTEYCLIEKYLSCRARINPLQIAEILETKIKAPCMTNDKIARLFGWKNRSKIDDILKRNQKYYQMLYENNPDINAMYCKLKGPN